jgi:hypothetical protein
VLPGCGRHGFDLLAGDELAPGPVNLVADGPFQSTNPSLVWNGSGFGVSFEDDRDGNAEIYFQRLDASGAPAGTATRVTNDVGGSFRPRLAWSGSEHGVFWDDNQGTRQIYGSRLDADGIKLAPDIAIATSGIAKKVSVAWTGTSYGMIWEDDRDGPFRIYFARIDPTGARIGADVRLSEGPTLAVNASLAGTGDGFGAVWEDNRDGNSEIYFARLDAGGARTGLDVRVTTDPNESTYPTVVWSGTEYGVVYQDDRTGDEEVYLSRLDELGARLGPDVLLSDPADGQGARRPSLVRDARGYAVAWISGTPAQVWFSLLDATGTRIAPELQISEDPVAHPNLPSLVATGDGFAVAWQDDRSGDSDIFVRVLGPTP